VGLFSWFTALGENLMRERSEPQVRWSEATRRSLLRAWLSGEGQSPLSCPKALSIRSRVFLFL